MKKFTVRGSAPLNGTVNLPGDKSISHRSVMVSSISSGHVKVENFLPSEDCMRTVDCMRKLGVQIEQDGTTLIIKGKGLLSLKKPNDVLYTGNSGTTIRLLMGLLSAQSFTSVLDGDLSIRKRPMDRVAVPLRMMGAKIDGKDGGKFAPIAVNGVNLHSIEYEMPMPSAQVKSAILLAGLYASGTTKVVEKVASRDHTERMLEHFGAKISRSDDTISLEGGSALSADSITIPSDISSAAFIMVAASLIPGSEVTITGVGVNPGRTGVIDVLHRMGARIVVSNERIISGEPVADIMVAYSRLKAIQLSGALIPRVIDEIPVIALAAALAEGTTVIKDAKELRIKESDRIMVVARELTKLGASIKELPDGLEIKGVNALKAAECESDGDHRIAMTCVVAGLVSGQRTVVNDVDCVDTSFPGFSEYLNNLSGKDLITQ